MIFKSKIGPEIFIPVAIVLLLVTLISIRYAFAGTGICSLVIVYCIVILSRTDYTITTENTLVIRCITVKNTIDIADITSIRSSRELSNAPALSLDRLEIKFKNDYVLVSPKDKMGFVNAIKQINSNVDVNLS